MAISLTINDKEYTIPTSWDDITFEKYAVIKNPFAENDVIKNVHLYTGIDIKTLFKMNPTQLHTIIGLVSFMDEDLTDYIPVQIEWTSGKGLKVNGIQFDTYGRLEKCKQIFKENENPYLAVAKVVKEYTDVDIMQMPVKASYAYADFFFHNSTTLGSDTSDLPTTSQTAMKC